MHAITPLQHFISISISGWADHLWLSPHADAARTSARRVLSGCLFEGVAGSALASACATLLWQGPAKADGSQGETSSASGWANLTETCILRLLIISTRIGLQAKVALYSLLLKKRPV